MSVLRERKAIWLLFCYGGCCPFVKDRGTVLYEYCLIWEGPPLLKYMVPVHLLLCVFSVEVSMCALCDG